MENTQESAPAVVNKTTETPTASTEPSAPVTPPAKENLAQANPTEEQKVPYPRFKELVDEKNQLKSQLEEMSLTLKEIKEQSTPKQPSFDDVLIKEYTEGLGVDEGTAKKLIELQSKIVDHKVRNTVKPLEEATLQHEVDSWLSDFEKSHSDYKDLKGKMGDVFASLPEHTQTMLASDPKGLELLYGYVKAQNLEDLKKQSFEEGKTAAYENRLSKESVGSSPVSTSVQSDLTAEAVGKMSIKEYAEYKAKNLEKVKSLLKIGG